MAVMLKGHSPDGIVPALVQKWEDMKQERSVAEETWKRCLYAYACVFDKKWADVAKAAGRSARYYPAIFDAVETLVPMIHSVIFNSSDWMTARPTRPGGGLMVDDAMAESIVQYQSWQLKQMKYTDKSELAMRQMAILGNVATFTTWRTDWAVNYPAYADAMAEYVQRYSGLMQQFEMDMQQFQMQMQAAQMAGAEYQGPRPEMPEPPMPPVDREKVYDGPDIQVLDIFNYCEEMYPNDEQAPLRVARNWKTAAYLKRMAKPDESGYKRYERLDSIGSENKLAADRDGDIEEVKAAMFGMQVPDRRKGVELLNFYGTFEIDGEIFDNYVAVVGNRQGLIRFEPSALWSGESQLRNAPLIRGFAGNPYGIGVVEKALGLNDLAQAQANQIVDAVAAVINPEYEVVYDGLYDVMKASGPGSRHYVKEKGTINPLVKNFQGLPVGSNQLQSTLQRIEQSTSAMYAASAGNPKESATMTAGRTNISSTKVTHIARAVEERLVEPHLNLMMQLNAQLMNETQFYMVTQGKKVEWKDISPEALRKGWLISAVGSRVFLDTEAKLNRDLMTIQMAMSNPAFQPITDMPYLWKKYLQNSGYEDADKIAVDTDEARMALIDIARRMAGFDDAADGAGQDGDGAVATQGQAPAGGEPGAPGADDSLLAAAFGAGIGAAATGGGWLPLQ